MFYKDIQMSLLAVATLSLSSIRYIAKIAAQFQNFGLCYQRWSPKMWLIGISY